MGRVNQDVEALRVGDRVTSDYHPGEEAIVRTITRLEQVPEGRSCSGGILAEADGGDGGTTIPEIWYQCSTPAEWGQWRGDQRPSWGVSAKWLIPEKE